MIAKEKKDQIVQGNQIRERANWKILLVKARKRPGIT